MSLQPVLHLKTVFKLTQKNVGIRKLRALALRNQLPVGQASQTHQRVRRAQPGVAPAEGELQGLRDKLYFAYPAAAELDVEAACVLRVLPVNLLLGEAHVRQGA